MILSLRRLPITTAHLTSKSWGASMIPSSPLVFLKRGMQTLTHGIEEWYSHHTSRITCPQSDSKTGKRSIRCCQTFRWRTSIKYLKYLLIWEKSLIHPNNNRIKSTMMLSQSVMMNTSSGDFLDEAALVKYFYMNHLMAEKLLSRYLMAVMFIKSSKLRKWFYKKYNSTKSYRPIISHESHAIFLKLPLVAEEL